MAGERSTFFRLAGLPAFPDRCELKGSLIIQKNFVVALMQCDERLVIQVALIGTRQGVDVFYDYFLQNLPGSWIIEVLLAENNKIIARRAYNVNRCK
jgi:hypothetical protein